MTAASYNRQAQKDAKRVLGHLKKVSGINYSTPGQILQRLAAGARVEDCNLIIDWWVGAWSIEHPNQRSLLDPSTPFKAAKFHEYLAKAKYWHDQGRLAPTHGTNPNGRASAYDPANWRLEEMDPYASQ